MFIGDSTTNADFADRAATESESDGEEPKEDDDADADSASRVFGSVIAVLAAAAMIQ